MIEEELIKIWQSSPNQERIKFEKSKLMLDMQSSVDYFHRAIKYRDLSELIGAMIGIPIFAYYAYHIPFIVTKIASVLIILWGVFVIIHLRNAKRHKPGAFTSTYREYLNKTREYLKIQKALLDNVLYWYILPAMTLIILFTIGQGITGRLSHIVEMVVGNAVVGITIYYLNRKAVKEQFIPRLKKIEELIKIMEQA